MIDVIRVIAYTIVEHLSFITLTLKLFLTTHLSEVEDFIEMFRLLVGKDKSKGITALFLQMNEV